MKKIGIVTYYYGSTNYGGLLQSYALVTFLIENGYDAKQICIDYKPKSNSKEINRAKKILEQQGCIRLVSMTAGKLKRIVYKHVNQKLAVLLGADESIKIRKKAVEIFRTKRIEHTELIYSQFDITDCNCFDIYITGSDQVWRGITSYDDLNPVYWLKFVSSKKKKISYAASISRRSIPQSAEEKIRQALDGFEAISVREKSDKINLERVINRDVEWVLDPTLLFGRDSWEKIAYRGRICDKEYVFAYLLGDDIKIRKWIEKFARYRKINILFIPYVLDEFRYCDRKFGTIRYSDISPEKWISLIRDAKYIITDSFHGSVFSILYRKDFLAFRRDNDTSAASSNDRLYSLLSLLKLEQQLIDVNYDPKTSLCDIDDFKYKIVIDILKKEREKSRKFLLDAIEK